MTLSLPSTRRQHARPHHACPLCPQHAKITTVDQNPPVIVGWGNQTWDSAELTDISNTCARSRRDRAEIAPGSRRDRAEIAPGSHAHILCRCGRSGGPPFSLVVSYDGLTQVLLSCL